MDIFQVVLLICILVAIALIVIALLASNRGISDGSYNSENTIKVLEASISEIDKTMEELNESSKQIFSEIDDKYQELLFLYSLMDEKKNEIAEIYSSSGKIVPTLADTRMSSVPLQKKVIELKNDTDGAVTKAFNTSLINENNNAKKILDLHRKGMTIADIAKQLNIGQGEVQLIIELGKNR